jgi:uncharacterized protein YjiS (DUF1127 family)
MSAIDAMPIPSERAGDGRPVRAFFGKVFRAIRERHVTNRELRRSRLHLFELSDAELRDIGLTREIAEREASRSLLACYLNNAR